MFIMEQMLERRTSMAVENLDCLSKELKKLEKCLKKESLDVEKNGLSLVYDMARATSNNSSNVDSDLAMKVLHHLGYPARLKSVYIVCAPLWFRTSMAVLSTYLRNKIRERVELIRLQEHKHRMNSSKQRGSSLASVSNNLPPGKRCAPKTPHSHSHGTLPNEGRRKTLSPNISPPPVKTQRTDKAPEKPLPSPPEKPLPPPPREDRKTSAEKILRILNDTMNETEKFLRHNNEVQERRKSCQSVDCDVIKGLGLHHIGEGGKSCMEKEYEQIKAMTPTGTFVSTLYPINVTKNRYNNILALEESRVRLEIEKDDVYSDYINASYVDGYCQVKKFICTQGPLPHTFTDFWRMIWEQKVIVIVMITRCIERGRTKCGVYWPEDEEETCTYGPFIVTNITSDVKIDFTSTLFELYNTKTRISRRVCHIQFTSWPDFGVLSSAEPVIEAISLIRKYQHQGKLQLKTELKTIKQQQQQQQQQKQQQKQQSMNSETNTMDRSGEHEQLAPGSLHSDKDVDDITEPPIVIHCSAGVGRTGTFCCLNNCIESYHASDCVDVYDTVQKIRSQRAFSVQTVQQYQFCYTGILEYIIKDRQSKGLETSRVEALLYRFLNDGDGR